MSNIKINTDFFTRKAFKILSAVRRQLGDGIWKDSPGYDKYWTNFNVLQEDDNQVVFYVNAASTNEHCGKMLENPFAKMQVHEFLKWYAKKIKAIVNKEAKDCNWSKGWWKRDNISTKPCLISNDEDVTIADVYCVYDWLVGSKDKTPQAVSDEIAGSRADEATVAAKRALKEAKQQALEQCAARQREIQARADAEKKAVYEEYCAIVKRLESENMLS